jgi:hypothetical protein
MEGGEMSVATFDKFAESLGLRYFAPHELRFLGGSHYDHRSRAAGLNTLPPPELWKNIIPVAQAADEAREIFGSPIRILSGYRSPEYNRAVGGARYSRHMQFDALDLAPMNGHVATLHTILRRLRARGAFTGGIGRYAGFIHIDARGQNVDF